MGGQISVESRQKEGTIFYVELEFEEADRRTVEVNITQPEDDKEQNLKGRHFLMVEDNEINAEILGELLRMWGAGFTVKKDGFQAVEEFKNLSLIHIYQPLRQQSRSTDKSTSP